MAEYLKRRVLAVADVVVAPTLAYHFYPSFLEYPGSTHLGFETSMMLYIAPDRVDMTLAVKEDNPRGQGGLTRWRLPIGALQQPSSSSCWISSKHGTRSVPEKDDRWQTK